MFFRTFILLLVSCGSYAQQASFTASAFSGCSPFTVSFTNTSISATSFRWYFDDGMESTEVNPVHTFYDLGREYQVKLIAYNGQNSDSTIAAIKVTGILPRFFIPSEACPGSSIQFTINSDLPDLQRAVWDFDDGHLAAGRITNHSFSQTGQYTIRFQGTTNVCGDFTDSATILISDTLIPIVHLHPETAQPFICPGDRFPYFYDEELPIRWEFGEGSVSYDPYPQFSYASPGEYEVKATVWNECGKSGMLTFVLTVSDTITPVAEIVASRTTVCPGQTISLSSFPLNTYDHTWKVNGRIFGKGSTLQTSFAETGAQTINLQVENSCGRQSESMLIITVADSLPLPAAFTTVPKKACPGDTIRFVAPKGMMTYQWDFGSFGTSSESTALVSFPSAGTFPVSLKITSYCGKSRILSDSIFISSSLLPEALISAPALSACPGEELFFTAYEEIPGTNSFYWKEGSKEAFGQSASFNFDSAGVYTVLLIATNKCGNSDTSEVVVQAVPGSPPLADFTINAGRKKCAGENVSFIPSPASGTFSWDFGDGATSADPAPSHSYLIEGNYLVTMEVQNPCGTNSIIKKSINVSSANQAIAQIALPDTICVGEKYSLTNTIDQPFFQYTWMVDGVLQSARSPEIIFSQQRSYDILLTVSGYCNNAVHSLSIPVADCTNDVQIISPPAITVSPNPGNGIFEIHPAVVPERSIKVTDITGKVFNLITYDNRLDLRHLEPGMYLLTFMEGHQPITLRVIRK